MNLLQRILTGINPFKNRLVFLENNVSEVYDYITGGTLNNPYSRSETVIQEYETQSDKLYETLFRADVEDMLSEFRDARDLTKEDLIEALENYFDIDEQYSIKREKERNFWKDVLKVGYCNPNCLTCEWYYIREDIRPEARCDFLSGVCFPNEYKPIKEVE